MSEPVRPPDEYTREFGTRSEYIDAMLVHGQYWQQHAHAFELCRQCEGCGLCFTCGLAADATVHTTVPETGHREGR